MARSNTAIGDDDLAAAWLTFADAVLARLPTIAADGTAQRAPELSVARELFRRSLASPGALSAIVSNSALSADEAETLAVVVAVELDCGRQLALARAQGDLSRTRLTLDTLRRLFEPGHPGVLTVGADAGLRRSALIDVVQDGAWGEHIVAAHPTLVWALVGDESRDPDLPSSTSLITVDDALGDGTEVFVVVTGADRSRRRAAAASNARGHRFLVSPAPTGDEGWAALVREAAISGCGVIIELDDTLPPIGRRWIEGTPHLPWALTSSVDLPIDEMPTRRWVEIEAAALEPSDDEWIEHLGPDVDRSHHLTFDQLVRVGRVLPAKRGDLDAAVRRLGSGRLQKLARRIRPDRDWGDIVLSADHLDQLRSLVDRYRHADRVYGEWGFSAQPSRGVVALFAGPSGTGKTLATEIVAGELGLDVFKLDLSAVVSKYIGETEKNLEEIFDAASAGNLVLFFDEADALFGKRSEVKDARDRYANIEVSYLLQRLESYDGLVVLATNFEKNVDEAFIRRIHARVEFVLPLEIQREAIWRLNIPATAPLGELDVAWLAKAFEVSGAAIRNAAVSAAFTAAAEGTSITTATAVRGMAREYRKMGRLLKPEDFGPYHSLVTEPAH